MESVIKVSLSVCPFVQSTSTQALRQLSRSSGGLAQRARQCPYMANALKAQEQQQQQQHEQQQRQAVRSYSSASSPRRASVSRSSTTPDASAFVPPPPPPAASPYRLQMKTCPMLKSISMVMNKNLISKGF